MSTEPKLHPNARQAAEPYRLRPFRRIRNLIEHLDTCNTVIDDLNTDRERAVQGWQAAEARIAKWEFELNEAYHRTVRAQEGKNAEAARGGIIAITNLASQMGVVIR